MRTLLVIDDEPNIVYSFKSTLVSPQLSVICASTAREGIELIKSQRPDVVMLDVRLPDLSGLQAYERIRQLDERLPVIVMTAFAKTETAIEAMRLGAFEYLVKPVDLTRLREIVAKALEVSRLNVPACWKRKKPTISPPTESSEIRPSCKTFYKGIRSASHRKKARY